MGNKLIGLLGQTDFFVVKPIPELVALSKIQDI